MGLKIMQLCKIIAIATASFLIGMTVPGRIAHAQPPSPAGICKIASIQGRVTVRRNGRTEWSPVRVDDVFYPGDRISTGRHCRVAIVLSNDSVLRIDQNTTLVFLGFQEKRSFLINMLHGAVHFFSRKARSLKLTTPFVNAGVEGTEFFVHVDHDQTLISLFEGRVRADNAQGSLLLSKGQSAVAKADQPPELKFIIRPRDAVQWTLYYPPIIAYRSDDMPDVAEHLRSRLSQSLASYQQGDLNQAINLVEGVSKKIDDTRFYVYRANLSLAVGRVPEALADIERALALEADNSDALALRSIIAVAQNRKDAAYADAQKAVDLNPDSPSALLALSYAHQAGFNLPAAMDQAQSAVDKAPENAIARARLAELRLSTGDLDGALRAARRAAELDVHLTHAQTVLGYAYLTQMEIAASEAAFSKAIQSDSAAPLPRLGLGLAKIRRGRLKEGRADIEIAAGLDPGNALIRSYLGKAYFDEKRSPLEERQFEIAKELDPQDPTPWFYDAIRKQSQNRPVAALHDLQKSIELNDNRSVYRSRLLLDADLAARSASLGRVYNDLNFQELALRHGWRSIQADPANYSAHRLLADAYRSRPRHEAAQVSELLQAQLLQPLSLTPVQSQLAESNLLNLESAGPDSAAFNEFNPLFARNRVAAQIDGLVGDNGTWGDNVTLSGVYDKFSGSVAQFHYETDGFRNNNDLDQDIYGAFMQAAITPQINLQAEYRHRNSKGGDLSFNVEKEPDPNFRKVAETDTFRAGMHLKPWPNSDIVGSVIYQDQNETQEFLFTDFGLSIPLEVEGDRDGFSGELQYLWKNSWVDMVAGGGYYDGHTKINIDNISEEKSDNRNTNGYVYGYVNYPKYVTWTIGASYDAAEREGEPDKNKVNPKIGMNLDIGQNTTLRLAAFTGFKRVLIADQTIEPTNVAGFNQFFNDFDLTEYTLYGVGLDQKFSSNLYGGAELVLREIESPIYVDDTVHEEDWEENISRAYLYWTFNRYLAFGVEYWHEYFSADETLDTLVPKKSETEFLPITLSYFHPAGGFGRLVGTHVSQEIQRAGQPGDPEQDGFVLVDAVAGYRLPKRMGALSAEIRNVFDQDFEYVDESSRFPGDDLRQVSPLFLPQRTYVLRLTLSF
jgi:Tfp pilus assembly protein PilF